MQSTTVNQCSYVYVELGPLPTISGVTTPAWHVLSEPSRYPFPSSEAAERFANAHKERDPDRVISIRRTEY